MSRLSHPVTFVVLAFSAGCLATAVVFGIHAIGSANACVATDRTDTRPFAERNGSMGSDASVVIDLECADAQITAQPGSDWSLAGDATGGIAPSVDAEAGALAIRSVSADGTPAGQGGLWRIAIPSQHTMTLAFTAQAGSLVADLAAAHIARATVSANAAAADVDLAGTAEVHELFATANGGNIALSLPATDITGDLAVNDGAIRICAPKGSGVRFSGVFDGTASKAFEDAGLVGDGSAWTTVGYAAANTHVEFTVRVSAGRIDLLGPDGCTR